MDQAFANLGDRPILIKIENNSIQRMTCGISLQPPYVNENRALLEEHVRFLGTPQKR